MKILSIPLFLLIFISAHANTVESGADLYAHNCAACHGDAGNGGVGVPISLPGFLDNVSDEYLKKTIRLGRPGRVMPAFTHMSDRDVDAIARYVRAWSGKPAPQMKSANITGNKKNGEKLYKQYCVSCHGIEGKGGAGTGVTFSRARSLPIIAPALGNDGFLASASDSMIKDTIMSGRTGTPMDSYIEKGLSEIQINDVVSYIRSLQGKHKTASTEVLPANLVYESDASMKETLVAIKKAIVGANFRVIRVQAFEDGYVKKGKEDNKKIIIYFCNFNMLYKALAIDPRVGLFLPCRITLVEKHGKVKLISINPATMSKKFNNDELLKLCDEMTALYESIMEEATL